MSEAFTLLEKCGDRLPVNTVVDDVAFYRFVPLAMTQGSKSVMAVYPSDYALPELAKEVAASVSGWPSSAAELVEFRGGQALLRGMRRANPQAIPKTRKSAKIRDLDAFLADPRIALASGGARRRFNLTESNERALLATGTTLAWVDAKQPVLLDAQPGATAKPLFAGTVTVSDVSSGLRAMRVLGGRVSAGNVRELRETGATSLATNGAGDRRELRVTTKAASSNGVPVSVPWAEILVAAADEKPKAGWIDPNKVLEPFRFVLFMPYRQRWTLQGLARGDHVKDIWLSPDGETTIEVFTWDRRRSARQSTEEQAWESSVETETTGRTSRDIARETTNNEAWKLTSAGVNVGVANAVTVGANIGGEFGTEVTAIDKNTTSRISEATEKTAAKERGLRQMKVEESREWGLEERTTQKIKNPNRCRSLTYRFFEVTASYQITTALMPDQIQLAVVVPTPLVVTFDRHTLIAFEGSLKGALLDPVHARGFDAARWLAARDNYCLLRCEKPCCEKDNAQAGTAPEIRDARPTVIAVGDRLAGAVTAIRNANRHLWSDAQAGLTGPQWDAAIVEYRRWLFRVFVLEKERNAFWAKCLQFANEWSGENKSPERVEALNAELGGGAEEAIRGDLVALTLPSVGAHIVDYLSEVQSKVGFYAAFTAMGGDDAGLGRALSDARSALTTWRTTPVPPAPTASGTKAEPFPAQQAAIEAVHEKALITHLTKNRLHYLEALWRGFDPADRERMLQTVVGNLAADVEPQVLGFVGDKVALPFRVQNYPALEKEFRKGLRKITKEAARSRQTVSVVLPSGGVVAIPDLDSCESCEPFIIQHRALDLAEKRASVRRAKAEARRATHEAERLRLRVTKSPNPLLDPPDGERAEIAVKLLQPDGGGP